MPDSIGGWDSSYPTARSFLNPFNVDRDSFMSCWGSAAGLWAIRHQAGDAVDRYISSKTAPISKSDASELSELGFEDVAEEAKPGPISYRQILKLSDKKVDSKDLSGKNLYQQIKNNTSHARRTLGSGQIRNYFQGLSFKDYAKYTLWEGNARPIKELLKGSTEHIGSNCLYTAGVGYVGFKVARTARDSYRYWKAQEDGSIGSQWKTAYETVKTTGEKAIQSLASWEAAGVGFAVGEAILPICSVPIGGILIGACFATAAYKAFGKLFPGIKKVSRPEASET